MSPVAKRTLASVATLVLVLAVTGARFDLEWIVPLEPGLLTHVQLMDHAHTHDVLAIGHGGDEAEALMDLRHTLVARQADDAARFVAAAYVTRTGHPPAQSLTPDPP